MIPDGARSPGPHRATRILRHGIAATLALTFATGSWPSSSRALELRLPPRDTVAADSLRVLALKARLSLDWDLAARTRREVLTRLPGDGFVLREIAIEAMDRGSLAELAAALRSGASGGYESLPELAEADRAYLEGMVALYRGRLRSARESFDRAVQLRPEWGWARYYRGRAGVELLESPDSSDRRLEAALRDPDCAPAVVDWLLSARPRRFRAALASKEDDLLRCLETAPWVQVSREFLELRALLEKGSPTVAAVRKGWNSMQAGNPVTAAQVVTSIGSMIRMRLPPSQALSLLASLESASRSGAREEWRLERASLLEAIGRAESADSIFRASPLQSSLVRQSRFGIHFESAPPETLAAEARRLVAEYLSGRTVSAARAVLEPLGRDEEVQAILREVSEQQPALALQQRWNLLIDSDPNAARALSDSLERSDLPSEHFLWNRFRLGETSGDTLSVRAILALEEFPTGGYLATASFAAYGRGSAARGERLFAMALERAGGDYELMTQLGSNAARRRSRSQVAEVLRTMVAACPDCPELGARAVDWKLEAGDREGASADLKKISSTPGVAPRLLAALTYSACSLDETALADTLSARALRADPRRRDIQAARAWFLVQQGDHAGGARLMQPLVEQFPGREDYQYVMASAAGAVTPRKTPAADGNTSSFDLLAHDLTSTDWIEKGLGRPDSLGGAIAVQLLSRSSYVYHPDEGFELRTRVVVKLATPQAVESYQTMRIAFLPTFLPPVIRSARIVFPDGRVAEVPRKEIVVASSAQAGEQVTDLHHLVVPFASLKVGAAIDLVWDQSLIGGGSGRAFRLVLNESVPIRESIVEVVRPAGTPLAFRQGALTSAPESSRIASYAIHRWTMRDLPAMSDVPLGGSFYDRYAWMACSSYRSWNDAARDYAEEFWRRAVPSEEIRRMGADLARRTRDPEQKLRQALDSLSARVEYLAIEMGSGRTIPSPAPDVLRRGYGDCKEMVTLAVTLLEAAGLEAQPVLLTPRSQASLSRDLVEPELFTHMVLWVPGVRRGVYCDLTLRPTCIGTIGADYEGTLGLRMARSGATDLVTLPTAPPGDHGYSMEIDVRPSGDGTAEFGVRARFRGELARTARELLAVADSEFADYAVDRVLGLGLPESCRRRSWTRERDDCQEVVASAVYRDSAWSTQSHSVVFAVRDEVADPFLVFPQARDRKFRTMLVHGYRDTVVVRLHAGGGWEPEPELATVAVRGPQFSGRIENTRAAREGGDVIEIRQVFEMRGTDLSTAEYAEFHRNVLRYSAVVYQPYRYRRALDRARLDQVREYCREHPKDIAYALQAASEILGQDAGGEGPGGIARRTACRDLLARLRHDPDAGVWPQIYLAMIEIVEGRYRAADSLAQEALGRDGNNLLALVYLVTTRAALGDREGELSYLRELSRRSPSDAVQIQLLSTLYREGLDEEAGRVEARLISLHGAMDSTAVCGARLTGFLASGRCKEARGALECLRPLGNPASMRLAESGMGLQCGPLEDAMPALEELWREDPLNPIHCNNLAWAYALLGRELDTAEEIAHTAITLSGSFPEGARNTLGAIIARRGQWKEARALFQTLLDGTETLESRVSNGFFIGLCDYQLGRKDDALRRWRELLPSAPPGEWRTRISRALELSAGSKPVTDAIFIGAAAPKTQ